MLIILNNIIETNSIKSPNKINSIVVKYDMLIIRIKIIIIK